MAEFQMIVEFECKFIWDFSNDHIWLPKGIDISLNGGIPKTIGFDNFRVWDAWTPTTLRALLL